MDCGFCIDAGSEYDVEFYRATTRTARKAYKCYECGAEIARGDQYEYATGKCEGEIWEAHTCLDCADIAKALSCNGRVHGSLWDDFKVAIDYGAKLTTGCLNKLTRASAKANLVARWNEMTLGAGTEVRR